MSTQPDLEGFADELIDIAWQALNIDGADIQEIAVRCGLLQEVTATESCGEYCTCAQYSDFPTICYRKTGW